jgi:Zn-dependent protease
MLLVPMILSLTVHEFAHAWSAFKLGDDTAQKMGRMTLNPIPHIDIFGTILLPLLGVPFGWAKPVPVNPARFRRTMSMGTGMMITAAAGPISNIILAILCSVIYGLCLRFLPDFDVGDSGLALLLIQSIVLNISLAIFNLIPIPPLDGSRVVDGLLPRSMRGPWEAIVRISPILLILVFVGGRYLLSGPVSYTFDLARRLIHVVANV